QLIFQRYLALGCVSKLRADLDQKGVRSKQRILTSGRVLGGGSFGRGALYHLLRNRLYRGEVVHKGIPYPGEHEAIVKEELWNAVQARLAGNRTRRRQARIESGAPLGGLLFDDRGNRMSPTYTVRRGNRYRYYISQARLQGGKAGSRPRINADDIERVVVKELCRRDGQVTDLPTGAWTPEMRELVRGRIDRIVIHRDGIEIALKVGDDNQNNGANTVRLALPPNRPRERKEILVPGNCGTQPRRIDQALILALARARSWMRSLRQGEFVDTAEIA